MTATALAGVAPGRQVVWERQADKDLEGLPKRVVEAVAEKVWAYAQAADQSSSKTLQALPFPNVQIRAGKYRTICALDDNSIYVLRVVRRKDTPRVIQSLAQNHEVCAVQQASVADAAPTCGRFSPCHTSGYSEQPWYIGIGLTAALISFAVWRRVRG